MGNIVDKMGDTSSLITGLTTCGILAYIVNDALYKKSQRVKILEAIQN